MRSKNNVVEDIAERTKLSKSDIALVLDALKDSVAENLAQDGEYVVYGVGTLVVSERAARKGRNPSTGEEIDIKASKSVRLKPSKVLRDAVNHDA